MKILIATGIYPPDVGGPATYSKILSAELARRLHRVQVVTYADSVSRAPADGVIRIARSRFKPWHYYKFYRALVRAGRDVDVIYAQGPVSEGYPAYGASRFLKKTVVGKNSG